MPTNSDAAKATESETVERTDADDNPVDENGQPLTTEQEAQQSVGENVDQDVEAQSGLSPEAEQANNIHPATQEETTDGD